MSAGGAAASLDLVARIHQILLAAKARHALQVALNGTEKDQMADDIRNITSYSVLMYSGTKSSYRVLIRLFGAAKQAIGTLYFMREGLAPKDAELNPNGNTISLYYPAEIVASVLDVLRNEKPLRITYNAAAKTGALSSGLEAVGQGDV